MNHSEITSLLFTAQQLHQTEAFAEAKIYYEKILALDPTHVDALLGIGLIAAQNQQYTVAIQWFEQALSHASTPHAHAHIHCNIGNCFRALKQKAHAEFHYTTALNYIPDYAQAHNSLGNMSVAEQRWQEALKHYHAAVQSAPDYVEAHFNLGLLFLKQKEWQHALTQFKNVIELQPQHSNAHYYLGQIYLQEKKLEEAATHYQAVLNHDPENADAWCNIGVIAVIQESYQAAIDAFSKAILNDPTHVNAHNNLAALFLKFDRFESAVRYYEDLLNLQPSNEEALFNNAVALMSLGQLAEAEHHLQTLLRLNPQHADAWCNLGAIALRSQRMEQAKAYYERACALTPDHPTYQFMMAALSGDEVIPPQAPNEYIKNLFNNYATYFEHHLNALDYKAPEQLADRLAIYLDAPTQSYSILELGCGTGLCGVYLKPYAQKLIGIDLSEKMIAQAQNKNVYDEVRVDEISAYLKKCDNSNETYDLIVAVDVLCYFGELGKILELSKKCLKDNALFIFTVEALKEEARGIEKNNPQGFQKDLSENKKYILQTSGRYAHRKSYIEKIAQQYGFELVSCDEAYYRKQDHQMLGSYWVVMRKL